jgi:uncharacterized membrane protein YeaQ/YmgE (transglycosylase-associated protein family)
MTRLYRLLGLVGSLVGSYAGWALGHRAGTMTAFFISAVGAGVGLWAGRRMAQDLVD